jgi:integrase
LLPVLKEQLEGKSPDDYVFTYEGKKINNNHGAFKSAVEKAEIGRNIKLHHYRHWFGTWLMRKGTPDKIAMEILGHSDASILHIYQHPDEEDKHKAVRNGVK